MDFVEIDVEEMLTSSQKIVESSLGRKLGRADPVMLLLKSFMAIIIQQRTIINDLARQNLLYYARGETLNHIGYLVGCERLEAEAATVTVEVELSAARTANLTIMKGTRVTAGDNIFFALDDDLIFAAGETLKQAKATCTTLGAAGNNYAVGELRQIVDPQAFLKSIVNVTASGGGADVESDDKFRERIRQAPETFSTAGPARAYEMFTKEVSSSIADVVAITPLPGEVEIYPLLEGGELPGEEMLEKISSYLNDRQRRPLTDKVTVLPPVVRSYDIELRYYISKEDAAQELSIVEAADKAVEEFILWQKSKLGRDINPTELYWRLRSAGVKRAEIIQPTFTKTDDKSVAVAGNISAVYAGLEDS